MNNVVSHAALATERAALPGHPFTAYRDDVLFVEDIAVSGLAKAHGTPLFVYSKAAMLSALAAYQRGFEGRDAQICYAMKANSSLAVLQIFARAGCGFDIVSGGELERVLAAGGDVRKVIFSGVGKTRAEMRQALAAGPQVWGRFDVRIEGRPGMLRVIGALMNLRSRLSGIATGDQAIFIERSWFMQLGGYADQPLMEDIELSRRLRSVSPPACLHERVLTSGRRWQQRGVWRTVWLMWRLRWRYWRGASPDVLAQAYR